MLNLIKRRWFKARFFGWLLQLVPFIRMISVTGSLASGESRSSSDIDFFIIGRSGRLWTVRFLCLFITQILRERARGKNHAGKICLNRFLADSSLIITPQNRYHAKEYSNIKVLYNINDTHSAFIKSNHWMEKYTNKKFSIIRNKSNWSLGVIRSVKEFFLSCRFGNWIEEKLKKYQLTQIKSNPFYHKKGSRLVTTSSEIYFHDRPR